MSVIKDELFKFLNFVWDNECVPENLASGKFVMLWKNKGSQDDPTKYRCIGMLNTAYKILSSIILYRLIAGTDSFLKDWQAGFRAGRGTKDNIMIFRTLCDKVMALGKSLAAVFIDYSAAFDTVSHKHLDKALAKAGASNKLRAMFRAIYNAASAFVELQSTEGGMFLSDSFPIRRGVVQGDMTSPLYFILALELILRDHDKFPGKGIPLASTMIHTLGYADDIGLTEWGDEDGCKRLSLRVTSISLGSRKDADMALSVPKTKALHVRTQDAVGPVTEEEALANCKFTCPHLGSLLPELPLHARVASCIRPRSACTILRIFAC